jgi:hypothetical protein
MLRYITIRLARLGLRTLSLAGYFIASIPYANLYILARGPDRNLSTYLDQADERLGWLVHSTDVSTPPWAQFSLAAFAVLFLWWFIEGIVYDTRYKTKISFTAFVFNAKMNVAFVGCVALFVVTLFLAIQQGTPLDPLPAASLLMIFIAYMVFLLEFLVIRTLERLFGDGYEHQGFKHTFNFFWNTNPVSKGFVAAVRLLLKTLDRLSRIVPS